MTSAPPVTPAPLEPPTQHGDTPRDHLLAVFGPRGLGLVPGDRCHVHIGPLTADVSSAIAGLPVGTGIIVLVPLEETSLARVVRWLRLRGELARITRVLETAAVQVLGRHAFFPDVLHRRLVYALDSSAGTYAQRHLIPASDSGTVGRALRQALLRWSGCHPSVGAIACVGRRR